MPKSCSRGKHGGRGKKVSNVVKKRVPARRKRIKPIPERTLAELQVLARSRGIPFGGLTRTQLIEKIIAYQ